MVTLDQFPKLGIDVLAIGLALRLDRLIVSRSPNRTRHEGPIITAGIIKTHAQALLVDGGGQLANNIAGGVSPVRRQLGVQCRARPKCEPIVMFSGQNHIFRAGVTEGLGPVVRTPFLDFLIEEGSEIVVVVVGSVMLAMVSLGRGSVDTHNIQIPLSIGIVLDVVGCREVVLGMDQRSPARNRIKAPMNKYSQFCVGIPLRQKMLVQRSKGRLVVRRRLSMGS